MSSTHFNKYIKKIGVFVVIIILLVIIKNISSSILSITQRGELLDSLRLELTAKKQERQYLSQKLHIAKTDAFVEEEARSRLGLTREGEQIVIDTMIEPSDKQEAVPEEANWQKWLTLFTR